MTEVLERDVLDRQILSAMATLNEQRATTYGMLARLARVEADDALLVSLRELRLPLETGSKDFDEGSRLISHYLSNAWENSLTELAVDFVRIFIGRGADSYAAAYPFESVYRSPKRLLMQEARDEVLAIYRGAGLDKKEDWREGEDHLALELEFMQILCNRVNAALCKGDEEEAHHLYLSQKNFLEEHLLSWAFLFTSDVKRFAQTGFYQGFAFLLDGFLSSDFDFLCEVVPDERGGALGPSQGD